MSDKNIVKFAMPDGTLVSNDPDFDQAAAMAEYLDGVEDSGHEGATKEQEEAQRLTWHKETLNSGQPGVGENAVPDDMVREQYGPQGTPAQRLQVDDKQTADDAGASPSETSVDDDEPVDSNDQVAEVTKQRQDRAEAARQALIDEGDEPGDPDEAYSEWSVKQLKLEVAVRNADPDRAEDNILTLKGKKRGDVEEMLTADDARSAAISQPSDSSQGN